MCFSILTLQTLGKKKGKDDVIDRLVSVQLCCVLSSLSTESCVFIQEMLFFV